MSYYREIDVEKFKEVLEKNSLKITSVEQIKQQFIISVLQKICLSLHQVP